MADADKDSASGSGTGKSGAARSGTARSSTARSGAGKSGTARSGAAKSGVAKSSAGKTSAGETAAPAGAAAGARGLKIHHLRPAPGAHTSRTRVGRGEASKGKTAGRGTKGTRARGSVPLNFEGGQMPLHRRVPKLRGFSNAKFTTTYQVINTGRLAELYPGGGDVTPEDLAAKGAIRAGEMVKVLGTGDTAVALRVSAHAFSASARDKITAAGGTVTEL